MNQSDARMFFEEIIEKSENEDNPSEVEILAEIDEYVYCAGDYIELGSLVDNIGEYYDNC